MRTIKILLLSALTSFTFSACSNDDDNNLNNSQLAGKYNLTYLHSSQATDYNQDGTASQNLMLESDCYLNNHIILNEDMSYTSTKSFVFFLSETGCRSEERLGTWELNGNKIILTDMTMTLPSTEEYELINNELFRIEINGQFPTRDDEGNPVYLQGDLEYTFTKVN